jgi:hypothetical protein
VGPFFAGAERGLILYVRQLGWLHAAPKSTSKNAKDDDRPPSRMQTFTKDGGRAPLPERGTCGRLIDWLFEVGPTVPAGMGPAPLTHSEIRAWQENSRMPLTSWEARMLRVLSREYLSESLAADDPKRPPPWIDPSGVMADHATNQLREAFAALDAL